MTDRTSASWVIYALGALCAGAIAAAILVVGPASGSQSTVTRTATVAQGVVQSTVSGSGNLQALSQLNLGFKTSGTVTHIYATQGEQVARGQLLATLDPQSAEVTLEQAKATLQSAEANLAKEEETNGEGSTASAGGSAAGSASAASAAASGHTMTAAQGASAATAPTTTSPSRPTSGTTTAPSASAAPTTTPASTTPTTTTPATSAPSRTTGKEKAPEQAKEKATTKATEKVSAATREANLASAKAAVKSDKLTAQSDEQAVQDTKLYAPQDGTIVSLSGQVGETVSGGGTTKASSSSGSSGASGAGASGSGAAASSGRSAAGSSSSASSASSGSSSTAFAILSDLTSMQLVVPLSESEIGNVKRGQIATVTVEALGGRKLAAHVSEVAILSTSNSGVVSYDVTFQLDQMEAGLKPGMSANAEVVVKQAEGINVPTSAISAGTVTVIRSGKHVRQRVVTGLAGNSSTIVLGGLKAGEEIALPSATTSTSTSTGRAAGLGRGGAGGLGGGGGGGLPGGGAVFFRGGG